MPRKLSLSSAEFMRFKPARRINGRFFTLLIGPAASESAKLACVVSKKVSARAVVRNSIKRRCRAALRGKLANIKKPQILVFYAKSAAAQASFADVQRDVVELLASAR